MAEGDSPSRISDEELIEKSLILVQQLFAEQLITSGERDNLKDMIFGDDSKLFGLMRRYSEDEEYDELKRQVIGYVKTQIQDFNEEIQEYQEVKAAAASTDAAAVLPSDVSITFSDSNSIYSLDVLPGGSNDDVEEVAEDAR